MTPTYQTLRAERIIAKCQRQIANVREAHERGDITGQEAYHHIIILEQRINSVADVRDRYLADDRAERDADRRDRASNRRFIIASKVADTIHSARLALRSELARDEPCPFFVGEHADRIDMLESRYARVWALDLRTLRDAPAYPTIGKPERVKMIETVDMFD